jgi:hypothetical protein
MTTSRQLRHNRGKQDEATSFASLIDRKRQTLVAERKFISRSYQQLHQIANSLTTSDRRKQKQTLYTLGLIKKARKHISETVTDLIYVPTPSFISVEDMNSRRLSKLLRLTKQQLEKLSAERRALLSNRARFQTKRAGAIGTLLGSGIGAAIAVLMGMPVLPGAIIGALMGVLVGVASEGNWCQK